MIVSARFRRPFTAVPAFLASLLLVAGLRAQSSSGAPQEPPPATQQTTADRPQFATGIDLVTLDVSVVDQNGNPTLGLGPNDFVLSVDGARRTISKVEFVRQSAASGPATEGWSTNEGAGGGRLIMLVIDQGNIGRGGGQAFVKGAERLLSDLGPGDRIALSVIPGGRVVDFTSHIALVRERLRQFAGSGTQFQTTRQVLNIGISEALALDRGDSNVRREMIQRECSSMMRTPEDVQACVDELLINATNYVSYIRQQSADSLTSLRQLITSLQAVPAPKTLVLLSEGLVIDRALDQVAWIAPVSTTSRVSLYAVYLDDTFSDLDTSRARNSPTASEDRQLRRDGLYTLAGLARGTAITTVGGTDMAFARLSRELTGYYLVGFEPLPGERDGREHNVKVEVSRRGVEIRSRRVFVIDPKESSERTAEDRLGEALRSPLLTTEVGVRVSTYNLPDPSSDNVRVLVAAGMGRPTDEAPVTAVAYRVLDDGGRLITSRIDRLPVRTSGDQRYLGTFVVAPGTFTLKVAALDADGRTGSAEHLFSAAVSTSGPITASDLVINDPVSTDPGALRPMIEPKVTGDTLVAYLEFEAPDAATVRDASVALEVAPDANAVALMKGAVTLDDPGSRGRRTGSGTVDLARLPPGDYVARAIVSVGGKPVARMTRPFAFDPSSAVRSRTSATVAGPSVAFDRSQVLAPPVLEYFLKPMAVRPGATADAVTTALDAARAGELATLADTFPDSKSADATAALLRGVGLLARGELEPAANAFRRSLALDSEMSAATFYLGVCYAAGGRDREAVGAWSTVLASDDERPIVFVLASEAYGRLREPAEALETAREAFERWPDDDAVRLQFVKAGAAAKQRREALDALDPYISEHPEDHETILFGLKVIYDVVADGKRIVGEAEDQQRFARYLAAYRAAGGPDVALVERWQKTLWGK